MLVVHGLFNVPFGRSHRCFFPPHFREFTYFEIVNLIREAGFEINKATTEKVWHFWDFRPIEKFMRENGYSLDFRGDDTFVISCKSSV